MSRPGPAPAPREPVELVVQLLPGAPAGPAGAVVAAEGLVLRPQHPGDEDPELAGHLFVACVDPTQAGRFQAELLALPSVDGAYVVPPTALP